ncbi:MAG TPA: hypothetical protein VEI26_10975 [Terriglobales bacterium]|nr:hypothetical protein [Terriglobales bacterium]
MKKFFRIALAVVAPLGVAGALIYKVKEGQVSDPVFFVLIVIVPSTVTSAIKYITAVLPPAKIKVRFLDGTRAKHWVQASSWDKDHTRKVTSVYVPMRFENHDPDKDVKLYDVTVRDKTAGTLAPPKMAEIQISQKKQWSYLACDYAEAQIFNADETTVHKASKVDLPVIIQENDVHRNAYELEIFFQDNYGRRYILNRNLVIQDFSTWETGTTEWKT